MQYLSFFLYSETLETSGKNLYNGMVSGTYVPQDLGFQSVFLLFRCFVI